MKAGLVFLTGSIVPDVTIKQMPDDVLILDRMDIPRAFKKSPKRLTPDGIAEIYDIARVHNVAGLTQPGDNVDQDSATARKVPQFCGSEQNRLLRAGSSSCSLGELTQVRRLPWCSPEGCPWQPSAPDVTRHSSAKPSMRFKF